MVRDDGATAFDWEVDVPALLAESADY